MKTTVICYVQNREQHLRISLPSWLQCPEVAEVIVIDAGSRIPVSVNVLYDNIERVRVIRISPVPRTVALNVAIGLAETETVLRLDADYILPPFYPFFSSNALEPGVFVASGDSRTKDDWHLYGLLWAYKSDLLKVNGYNERLVTWGYEDADLRNRLEGIGLKRRTLGWNTVIHIPHPDWTRTTGVHGKTARTHKELNAANKRLAEQQPWTANDHMSTIEDFQ